jgi:hypothetical protein
MASFSIPENFSAPDGVKEGQEFSEIATFKIDGDQIHILTIGQDKAPVSGKEDKKDGKPKGAKAAMKEQLASLEDKKGSASMEDTEQAEQEG